MNQLLHIPKIEQYKTENDLLIKHLQTFDYRSETQLRDARVKYLRYKEIQGILSGAIDPDDIKKAQYNIRAYYKATRRDAKKRILALKSSKCELCGNPIVEILEAHHIKPVSHGGTHDEDNFIVLCSSCHAVVHACIERGGINDCIRDYYADLVEKLEEFVKKGIGEYIEKDDQEADD